LDPAFFALGNGLSYDELMAVPMTASCHSLMDWNPVVNDLVVDGPLLSCPSIVDEASSASQLPNPSTLGLPWSSPDWPVEEDVLGGQSVSNYIQSSSGVLMESTSAQNELPSFTQTQAFQDVVSATIKFIRQHSIPTNFRLNSLLLPDPYKNLLHCPQTSTLMACFQNALCIGMEIQDLLTHRSPFYRPNTTISDDAQTLLTIARKPWMPLNLQPTLPQILIPHHPYLDLIPFPGLRSRAITLATTMPRLFDPMELKMDLFRDGMFWLRQGNGDSPPWEAKSWQIAPWFVAKWKLLLD
jgi:hypothetical protein